MFLLAGLVLALALITVTVVVAEDTQSPARVTEAQRMVGSGEYRDFRDSVRSSVRFLLSTPGMPDEEFRSSVLRLSDHRRLGFSHRDVNMYIRFNGTRERQLCAESPSYGSAGLHGIAMPEKDPTLVKDPFRCSNGPNQDGILHDDEGFIVAAALDIGLVEPRFSVQETIVVIGGRSQHYFRQDNAHVVAADVRDGPRVTDFPDRSFHVVQPPRSNIATIGAFAAVPHTMYAGNLSSRVVNWSAIVTNPSERNISVDRVEIRERNGNQSFGRIVHERWPSDGWSVGSPTQTVLENHDLQDRSPEFDGWINTTLGDTILEQANDQPGCKENHGAGNYCGKIYTEVDAGSLGLIKSGAAWINQTFHTPEGLSHTKITFRYKKTDKDALTNLAEVQITTPGGVPVWNWSCGLLCDEGELLNKGWHQVERNVTTLLPDTDYQLVMKGTQEVDQLTGSINEARIWYDDAWLNLTGASASLVWDADFGSSPVVIGPSNATDLRVRAEMAQHVAAQNDSFDVAVHTSSGKWFNRSVPGYRTWRDSLKPTVQMAWNHTTANYTARWYRNTTGGRTMSINVTVAEESGAFDIPPHYLDLIIPEGWLWEGFDGDYSKPSGLLAPPMFKEVDDGTRVRLERNTTTAAGSMAEVRINVTPPSVGTETLYRLRMQTRPIKVVTDLDYPQAIMDPVVRVDPVNRSAYPLDVGYYSEDLTAKYTREEIKAVEHGLKMRADRPVPVTVWLWNQSGSTSWDWSPLRTGIVDSGGVDWTFRQMGIPAAEAGILNQSGADNLTLLRPPPFGSYQPGHAVLRITSDHVLPFRLHVNLVYHKVEYV